MLCPIDQTELAITERQGIEIDYCPKCRGVWLDRGELDKLIDRSESQAYSSQRGRDDEPRYDERSSGSGFGKLREAMRGRDRDDDDDDYRYDRNGRRRKKKDSFLDDLFDF